MNFYTCFDIIFVLSNVTMLISLLYSFTCIYMYILSGIDPEVSVIVQHIMEVQYNIWLVYPSKTLLEQRLGKLWCATGDNIYILIMYNNVIKLQALGSDTTVF
jgi:hypothetical protein